MAKTGWSLCLALVILSVLCSASGVSAHGGPARLELSSERLHGGATLEIRGVNIAADDTVTIWLVKGESSVVIGEVTGDEHGDFVHAFSLPADLPSGSYAVLASIPQGRPVSTQLVIENSGGAVDAGEIRDRSEPLLLPSVNQTNAEVQPPLPVAQLPTQEVKATSSMNAGLWAGVAGMLLLILLGMALVIRYTGRPHQERST